MTTPRTITDEWLKENNACPDAIGLFCAEWPEGCEVTQDNLVRADALRLNLEWFAKCVLPEEVFAEFEDKRAALYAVYAANSASLFADYEAQRDVLMHADFQGCRSLMLYADREGKSAALYADYEAKAAPLTPDYLSNRCALIIPFLLNHFAALPASNASDKAAN